jgi:dihydroorotate dehydrogenase (fumarate)
MTTSSLLKQGPENLATLREGLETWLARRGYESVRQMKGAMSQRNVGDPSAFERANYVQIIQSYRNPYAA